MTSSINELSYFRHGEAEPLRPRSESNASTIDRSPSKGLYDTVNISAEATKKFLESIKGASIKTSLDPVGKKNEQDSEEARVGSWKLLSGLNSGTNYLKNGNKQVVTIEGGALKLQEFKGDRLLKEVNGTISDDTAVLDTIIFGKSGKITQTIHTELQKTNGDGDSAWISAKISRNIEWLENGDTTKSMNDSMVLKSKDPNAEQQEALSELEKLISLGTEEQSSDIEDITSVPDNDSHITDYIFILSEYSGGKLSREISLNQESAFINMTNRSDKKIGELDAGQTTELAHASTTSFQIRNYDSSGNLINETAFDSRHIYNATKPADGIMEQSMSVSWYNKGELVKRSHGDLTVKETEYAKLPKVQNLLETLGLKSEEYTTKDPKTASELLAMPLMDSSSKAGFYTEALRGHMAKGHYDAAERIADYGAKDTPYSVAWTNEIYRDEKLIARQKDTESAIVNVLQKGLFFKTGQGLTENDDPATLRRSSHIDESYKDGRIANQAKIESREYIDVNSKEHPDMLMTATSAKQDKRTISQVKTGGISENDAQGNTASRNMGREVDLSVIDMYLSLSNLDNEYSGPEWKEYKVRLEL